MAKLERTLTMIKPDAVRNGHLGVIIDKITSAGFKIIALKMTQLSRRDAGLFYAEHEGNMGLMHAAEKFDYQKENRFSTNWLNTWSAARS